MADKSIATAAAEMMIEGLGANAVTARAYSRMLGTLDMHGGTRYRNEEGQVALLTDDSACANLKAIVPECRATGCDFVVLGRCSSYA